MTEQEAKQKWCPMVRYMDFEGGIINNRGQYLVGSFPNTMECIASDCMMWQISETYWMKDGVKAIMPDYASFKTPEEGGFITVSDGYCGLANKP